jgi:membrane protein
MTFSCYNTARSDYAGPTTGRVTKREAMFSSAPRLEDLRANLRSLGDLARATYAAFRDDGCRALSAALVYYSTLSTVPLIILVISLPGLMLRFVSPEASQRFVRSVETAAGPAIGTLVTDFLERVQSQSLVVAGVSLVMLLYSASSGFRFMRYAFRWIWREEQPRVDGSRAMRLRKTLLGRSIDFLIAFGMAVAAPLVATAGLLAYGLMLFARALLHDVPLVGDTLGSLLTPTLLLGLYAAIYILLLWVMPPVRLRWSEIWLPGLICAVAVLLSTYVLAIYIRLFSASSLYGAISTIFALQIWTYANAIILFSCAELCKLLVREHSRRQGA